MTWEIVASVLGIVLVGLQAWKSSAPARDARRLREQNMEIHREIAERDLDAVRRRLGRLRAQAP
jgi:hypothetical protein